MHRARIQMGKTVGADLTQTRNFDRSHLANVANLGVLDETNKVFYNTSGLQLKTSLSGQRASSYTQTHRRTVQNLQRRGERPLVDPLREIQGKLKPEYLKEAVLTKKPTQADLKESLHKYGDKLNTFYQRQDIKKITED